MKTHTTTASGLLRSIAVFPVLAILLVACGEKKVIVEPEVIKIVEEPKVKAITDHPEIIEVIPDMGTNSYVLSPNNSPGYLSMNGESFFDDGKIERICKRAVLASCSIL